LKLKVNYSAGNEGDGEWLMNSKNNKIAGRQQAKQIQFCNFYWH
jgi:hypothetical protein